MADNDAMVDTASTVFWGRTKALSAVLLALWLLVNLLVPWFARALDGSQVFGFPLGYWLAAEGALLVYLLIVLVYVWGMERLEARVLDDNGANAGSESSGPGSA